jgi:exonuclease V gamma subunit
VSRVHNAMRGLEYRNMAAPEKEPSSTLSNLVGALLEELADEIPDDLKLEAVKTDLVAASRSYENSKKKDLALRFYLATRALLREYEVLHDRLRHMEKKNQALEAENLATHADAKPEVHTDAATGAGA